MHETERQTHHDRTGQTDKFFKIENKVAQESYPKTVRSERRFIRPYTVSFFQTIIKVLLREFSVAKASCRRPWKDQALVQTGFIVDRQTGRQTDRTVLKV